MSKFVVSARKYRPKTFDEVVGQGHVSDTLKKALQSQQIAHAYLFCGPRGVGKTTCARILAKVMNCDTPVENHTPCNTCDSCKAFEEYASFNIIELDAASNNSVENIRSLIEQVRIQPQNGKYKTFIIDEVHMLSQAAFNAFLKTLEEPPPNVIFIMATTEKHKILPTILSRCQIYDFKRIQASDIVPQLEYILDQESKTADKEALHIIGQKADGAMRDALSIFDRIASAAGEHITYKDVVENLNILDYDYYFTIIDNLLVGNLAKVLLQYDDVIHKGFDGEQFIYGISEHLRNLLMLSFPETNVLLDVGDTLLSRYKEQVGSIPKNVLMTYLNLINECDVKYPTARNKRLHVEVTLSKMSYAPRLIESADLSTEKKTKVGNGITLEENSASSPEKEQSSLKQETSKPLTQPSSIPSKQDIQQSASSDTKISNNEIVKSVESTVAKKEAIHDSNIEPLEAQGAEGSDLGSELQPEKEFDNTVVKVEEHTLDVDQSSKEIKKPQSKIEVPEEYKEKVNKPPQEIKSQVDLVKNPTAISNIGFSIPSVSVNAFSNAEEIVREEELNRTENAKELSITDAQKVIDLYSEGHGSNSIKQVLGIVKVALDEEKLVLYVPSVIAQESVAQQDKMLELLREEFGRPDLAIPVLINADLFPDYSAPKLKVTLNDREKYILLVEKNPLLKDLQKDLDLHPDH